MLSRAGGGKLDPQALVNQAGWRLRTARLRCGGSHIQALLVPLADGGFEVVIDDEPTPVEEDLIERGQISVRDVRDFRIAHELGHSFFYRRHRPARRSRRPSAIEERFCDEFAWRLLGLPASEWGQLSEVCPG